MGIFRKKQDANSKKGTLSDSQNEKNSFGFGRRRSNYYQKYFRGYTEVRQLNAKGRVVVERYYTQPWIVSGLSKGKYWMLRLLYFVLIAASTVLFIVAMSQDVLGNYSIIVGLPTCVGIIMLFLLILSMFSYIFVEKKMTIWAHTSSTKKLKRYSLAASIAQLVTAIAMIVSALIMQADISRSLFCAVLAFLSAFCSGMVFLIERKVPYHEQPNDMKLPAGESYEIW